VIYEIPIVSAAVTARSMNEMAAAIGIVATMTMVVVTCILAHLVVVVTRVASDLVMVLISNAHLVPRVVVPAASAVAVVVVSFAGPWLPIRRIAIPVTWIRRRDRLDHTIIVDPTPLITPTSVIAVTPVAAMAAVLWPRWPALCLARCRGS